MNLESSYISFPLSVFFSGSYSHSVYETRCWFLSPKGRNFLNARTASHYISLDSVSSHGITCLLQDPSTAGLNPVQMDVLFHDLKILSMKISGSSMNLKPETNRCLSKMP